VPLEVGALLEVGAEGDGKGLVKVCETENGAVAVLCAGAEPELEPEPEAGCVLWEAPLADKAGAEPEMDDAPAGCESECEAVVTVRLRDD